MRMNCDTISPNKLIKIFLRIENSSFDERIMVGLKVSVSENNNWDETVVKN